MKTGSRMAFFLAVCLTLTMFACRETTPIGGSPGSPTQSPTVDFSQAMRTILMEYNPSINIQASLLSVLLLGIMAVAGVVEVITIATAAPGYSGYWTTVTIIPLLAFIYSISRTERLELTAPLTVVIMSLRPDSPDCSTCCSSRSGWAASTCA